MSEPIYKQVMRDLEGRAFGGKEQYGEHLTADTKIDGLQYLYEELLDGSNYIRKAMDDRRALLEYVARLEGAIGDVLVNWNGGTPPIERSDTFAGGKVQTYLSPSAAMLDSSVVIGLIATLATSPLAGQPQPAPASPWMPIAEAPRDGRAILGWAHGWRHAVPTIYWEGEDLRWCDDPMKSMDPQPDLWMPLPAPPQEGE